MQCDKVYMFTDIVTFFIWYVHVSDMPLFVRLCKKYAVYAIVCTVWCKLKGFLRLESNMHVLILLTARRLAWQWKRMAEWPPRSYSRRSQIPLQAPRASCWDVSVEPIASCYRVRGSVTVRGEETVRNKSIGWIFTITKSYCLLFWQWNFRLKIWCFRLTEL